MVTGKTFIINHGFLFNFEQPLHTAYVKGQAVPIRCAPIRH